MAGQLVHYGLLAEFDSADDVLRAAEQIRDAGNYSAAEAYTPFPIEGLAETLGFHRTAVAPIAPGRGDPWRRALDFSCAGTPTS